VTGQSAEPLRLAEEYQLTWKKPEEAASDRQTTAAKRQAGSAKPRPASAERAFTPRARPGQAGE